MLPNTNGLFDPLLGPEANGKRIFGTELISSLCRTIRCDWVENIAISLELSIARLHFFTEKVLLQNQTVVSKTARCYVKETLLFN